MFFRSKTSGHVPTSSQGLTQSSTLVNDKAVEAILPESLLDMLSQDLILSKHKKAAVASKVTSS